MYADIYTDFCIYIYIHIPTDMHMNMSMSMSMSTSLIERKRESTTIA